MPIQFKDFPVIIVLLLGAYFSVYQKKLTPWAAVTGFFCGLVIYLGSGYPGLTMLATFFVAGTLATSWGKEQKKSVELPEQSSLELPDDSAQRKPGQVLANGGTATLMALLILFLHSKSAISVPDANLYLNPHLLLHLMLAASLASATADTLSSELGMLYGKSFYNCITWKKEARGLDGVVSLEGTLIGIAGAALIAGIFALAAGFDSRFLIIVIAGAAGNLADSIFGATLERRKLLNNDLVNFLSTLFAAVVAFFLYLILKRF